jgi:hypothetical protein
MVWTRKVWLQQYLCGILEGHYPQKYVPAWTKNYLLPDHFYKWKTTSCTLCGFKMEKMCPKCKRITNIPIKEKLCYSCWSQE